MTFNDFQYKHIQVLGSQPRLLLNLHKRRLSKTSVLHTGESSQGISLEDCGALSLPGALHICSAQGPGTEPAGGLAGDPLGDSMCVP